MNAAAPARALYLRGADLELSPQDRRDLEAFYDHLRTYYGIPSGEPVFPEGDIVNPPAQIKPAPQPSGSRNRANHPWRASVRRRRP